MKRKVWGLLFGFALVATFMFAVMPAGGVHIAPVIQVQPTATLQPRHVQPAPTETIDPSCIVVKPKFTPTTAPVMPYPAPVDSQPTPEPVSPYPAP